MITVREDLLRLYGPVDGNMLVALLETNPHRVETILRMEAKLLTLTNGPYGRIVTLKHLADMVTRHYPMTTWQRVLRFAKQVWR